MCNKQQSRLVSTLSHVSSLDCKYIIEMGYPMFAPLEGGFMFPSRECEKREEKIQNNVWSTSPIYRQMRERTGAVLRLHQKILHANSLSLEKIFLSGRFCEDIYFKIHVVKYYHTRAVIRLNVSFTNEKSVKDKTRNCDALSTFCATK